MRAKGEGTIVPRKDGSWAGAIQWEGKRKWVYGKTRKEVAAKLRELRKRLEAGVLVDGGAIKLGEFLDKWLASARGGLAYKTVENYEQVVRDYLKPALGCRPIGKLRPDEVQQLLDGLREKGLSARSVQNIRAVLRRALNIALRWRYISSNPAVLVEVSVPKKRTHAVLTPEELSKLLAALKGHRWEALYWLVVYLGLRKGEVLGLHVDDVNLAAKTITISSALQRQKGALVRKTPKTESSRRELPIPDAVLVLLTAHIARQRAAGCEFLFTTSLGTPIEPGNLNRHFAAALKRAGVRKVRFHDLRHLAASELIRVGVDVGTVSAILGHANVSTTLNVYVHASKETLREAVNKRSVVPSVV